MPVFKVKFQSSTNSVELMVKTKKSEDLESFKYHLYNLFFTDEVLKSQNMSALQQNTEAFRNKLALFVKYYSKKLPIVNGLEAFFRRLPDNCPFYFLPNGFAAKKHDELYFNLKALEEKKTLAEVKEEHFKAWGKIPDQYYIRVYGQDRRVIGKSTGFCRFCETSDRTFKKKAHAISEGLGNKALSLLEECDQCNEKFSISIEPDIIKYLSLHRTFFGVKAKDGLKVYKGANFVMRKSQDGITIDLKSARPKVGKLPYEIPLETHDWISMQSIYKCLCKYFLSVINKKQLVHFKNTIAWINGQLAIESLPAIAEKVSYDNGMEQPLIVTYIRKRKYKTIPFAVCEFRFTCRKFVFIIPGINGEEGKFVQDKEFDKYWTNFAYYSNVSGWGFQDYSLEKKKQLSILLSGTLSRDLEDKNIFR